VSLFLENSPSLRMQVTDRSHSAFEAAGWLKHDFARLQSVKALQTGPGSHPVQLGLSSRYGVYKIGSIVPDHVSP
jgi:hypothetical protein